MKALVVVPAFNEELSISKTLNSLHTLAGNIKVLVVDDGSTDATYLVAKNCGVEVLQLPFNLGVGGAMRAGFLYAIRNQFDAVIQVDADGQHDASFVPKLIEALASADVVVGSRFSGEAKYATIGPRRWAMRFLAWSVSFICGVKLTDVTSGFRATGPNALKLFAKEYPCEYLGDTVESLVIAHKSGLKVSEIPVRMSHREFGRPSQSLTQASLFFMRAFLVLVLALVRPGRSIR